MPAQKQKHQADCLGLRSLLSGWPPCLLLLRGHLVKPKRGQTCWALTPGRRPPEGADFHPGTAKPATHRRVYSPPTKTKTQFQSPRDVWAKSRPTWDFRETPLCALRGSQGSLTAPDAGAEVQAQRGLWPPPRASLPGASSTYQGQADCRGSAGGREPMPRRRGTVTSLTVTEGCRPTRLGLSAL